MGKPLFQEEAYTTDGIIEMLRSQGLAIDDEDRARLILSNVSYTRLKNYLVPLMDRRYPDHHFHPGATFEKAYAIYGFDRRLRELIFHEMEKIEISIRTRMAFATSGKDKGYWFLNKDYYKSERAYDNVIYYLKREVDRSDNEAIKNFRKKYANEFPPSWIMLEAVTIGSLAKMYTEVSDESIRSNIASYYGMPSEVFIIWVRHIVSVRNKCAHHCRVWNNTPSVKACIPHGLEHPFPKFVEKDLDKLYMTFCILKYFINVIKPSNSFATRLKILINNFPDIDPAMMGFPKNWQEDPFWK